MPVLRLPQANKTRACLVAWSRLGRCRFLLLLCLDDRLGLLVILALLLGGPLQLKLVLHVLVARLSHSLGLGLD